MDWQSTLWSPGQVILTLTVAIDSLNLILEVIHNIGKLSKLYHNYKRYALHGLFYI